MSILNHGRKAVLIGGMAMAAFLAAPAMADEAGFNLYTKGYIDSLQNMKMMAMVDADKDHKVSRDEFMAHQVKVFEAMDRNKDGVIDQAEWGRRLGGIGGKGTS